MSGTLVIYRRELAGLFRTPLGWLILVLALFANGFFFYLLLIRTDGDIGMALEGALGGGSPFWMLLIFLPPLLSMRMLAEESRTGTLEYLLTAPVSDAAVVIGKHLAATTFMAVLWASVLVYGLVIHQSGVAPDWAALLCTWFGAVLASALFIAIGLLASAATSTPLLAAFMAFLACGLWLVLPFLSQLLMGQLRLWFGQWAGGMQEVETFVRGAVDQMDVIKHFQASFRLGVLDTAELVFFLTWPAFFLFLTVRVLEARRWRG